MAKVFSKLLTKTDVEKRLSFPVRCLPFIPCFGRGHAVSFQVEDEHKQVWTFRCTIRKKRYMKPVLSKGWLKFVRCKNLDIGDKVKFYAEIDEASQQGTKYMIKVKKAVKVFGAVLGYVPVHGNA